MKASIIIRTYNEEERLESCLQAVFSQQASFLFEVIIVDSESTDDTLAIASRFPVKIIKTKKKDFTWGKSLNIGCSVASGKYVVFLSGDAVPANGHWLKNLVKNLNKQDVAGGYGKLIPFPDCNPLEKRILEEEWPSKKQVQKDNPLFSVTSAAIRKDVWEAVRFNETIVEAEEQEWAMRVQKLKKTIVFDPEASVFHSHDETILRDTSRRYKVMRALYEIHGMKIATEHLQYWLYAHPIKRDIAYIRTHNYNYTWVVQSILKNGIFLGATTLYAILETPVGRTWFFNGALRLFSKALRFFNPLPIAYRLSFTLRKRFSTYARCIDYIKMQFRTPK